MGANQGRPVEGGGTATAAAAAKRTKKNGGVGPSSVGPASAKAAGEKTPSKQPPSASPPHAHHHHHHHHHAHHSPQTAGQAAYAQTGAHWQPLRAVSPGPSAPGAAGAVRSSPTHPAAPIAHAAAAAAVDPHFDENSHPFHAPLDHVREEERPLHELSAVTHFDVATLRKLQIIFTDIAESDVDDGIIDGKELTDAMGLEPSCLLARTIFKCFSSLSHQRKIDFAQWVKTISALSVDASLEEKIKFSFSLYDLNNDGCFPEEQTRVLTSEGFLFGQEIKARLARPSAGSGSESRLLFACYDTATKQLVYRPCVGNRLSVDFEPIEKHGGDLVDFTAATTKAHAHRWTAPDTEQLLSTDAAADDDGDDADWNGVSVRVTRNHRVFAQWGRRSTTAATAASGQHPPHNDVHRMRQTADGDTLAHEAVRADFFLDSVLPPTLADHDPHALRFLTAATAGVRRADKEQRAFLAFCERMELHPCDRCRALQEHASASFGDFDTHAPPPECEVRAFLELYGLWLGGGGTLDAADADGFHRLTFRHGGDLDSLRALFLACGLQAHEWTQTLLKEEQEQEGQPPQHQLPGVVALTLTRASWNEYFHSLDHQSELAPWVLTQLNAEQLRWFARGLARPRRSSASGSSSVSTSSPVLRDQLVHALLLAGYTARADCQRADEYQGRHPTVIPSGEADSLPPTGSSVCWRVSFASGATASHLAEPTMDRATDVRTVPYQGRVWCVEVDHPDHLIVAQRALVDGKSGLVVRQTRPVVVGNSIDVEELRAMLEAAVLDENVLHLSSQEVKDWCDYTLSQVDRDGNGKVDYEEYRSMVQNSVKFIESFTLDINELCNSFRFTTKRGGDGRTKLTAHEIDQRLLWFRARQKQYSASESSKQSSAHEDNQSQNGSQREPHSAGATGSNGGPATAGAGVGVAAAGLLNAPGGSKGRGSAGKQPRSGHGSAEKINRPMSSTRPVVIATPIVTSTAPVAPMAATMTGPPSVTLQPFMRAAGGPPATPMTVRVTPVDSGSTTSGSGSGSGSSSSSSSSSGSGSGSGSGPTSVGASSVGGGPPPGASPEFTTPTFHNEPSTTPSAVPSPHVSTSAADATSPAR